MSEGLVRQRRNLISISCVLIFLKFAEVEIDKLSFLGLDFGKIGNPSALYLIIWMFFFYLSIRYYQYFIQEGNPRMAQYYYECLEAYVQKHCEKVTKKISSAGNYFPQQLVGLEKEEWNFRVSYQNGKDELGGTIIEVKNIVFPKIKRRLLRVKSIINICLNTSAFSDYILPFILALGALIYCYDGADSSLILALRNGLS